MKTPETSYPWNRGDQGRPRGWKDVETVRLEDRTTVTPKRGPSVATAPRTLEILATLPKIVQEDRQKDYGHPLDNHTRTALMWRAYVMAKYGHLIPFDAEDVCWMNTDQKKSRRMNSPHLDSVMDVAGYAVNVAMIDDEKERRKQDTEAQDGTRRKS